MASANEMGVVISETTSGGLTELSSKEGNIMDYGSLITTTLQRAATAREAISIMANLTSTYGYASSGEIFSITDGDELWLLEVFGKGTVELGMVWVALRVPDGYITAHANQARITTFLPCDDPDTCLMSSDAVTFAIDQGYYNGEPNDPSFSFSDTYDPVTTSGARFCEARVWYIFSQLAHPDDFDPDQYLDYAQGFNLTNRMPLFVRPKTGITREMVHTLMSSHFENSWFDPANDIGAGALGSPYRWNGLTWTISEDENSTYVNERVIGTQYQAWHWVAEVKPSTYNDDDETSIANPDPLRALLWWGSDEHTWAPKVPLYGGATNVHFTYDDNNCSARVACRQENHLPGNMLEFSWDSAYWVNSAVAKLVYSAKDQMEQTVYCAKQDFEDWVEPLVKTAEQESMDCFNEALRMNSVSTDSCVLALTELAIVATQEATKRWTALWQQLMITFIDGYVTTVDESNNLCGCKKTAFSFSDDWKTKVVDSTGDRYRLPDSNCIEIDPDGHCVTGDDDSNTDDAETLQQKREINLRKTQVIGVVG